MLRQPWAAPVIVLLWALSSGWLFVQKIAPVLFTGEPPTSRYQPREQTVPVAWSLLWNDELVGWALSECQPRDVADNGWVVTTRLRFDELPLDQLLPDWARRLARSAMPQETPLVLDMTGELWLDRDGQLEQFDSKIFLPDLGQRIVVRGAVEGDDVDLSVRSRDFFYETTRQLPSSHLLGDELSPQATLPGLVVGRRWTVPVYNPLSFAGSPIAVLHAHVEGEVTLFWEDRIVRTTLVTYREDPASYREPRSRLWVDRGGRVLKQESAVLGSTLTFIRRTDEDAGMLARSVPPVGSGRPGSQTRTSP